MDRRATMLYKVYTRELSKMLATYFDDLVAAGDDAVVELSKMAGKTSTAEDREFESFMLAGVNIRKEVKT